MQYDEPAFATQAIKAIEYAKHLNKKYIDRLYYILGKKVVKERME